MPFTEHKLITYNGKSQGIVAWCRELDLPYGRVYGRMHHLGLSFEEAIKPGRLKRHSYKKKDGTHRRIVSDTQIRVNGQIIDGHFVKHTARGLFKSLDGRTYIQDKDGDFSVMDWSVDKSKTKLFVDDQKSQAEAHWSRNNGYKRQALRKEWNLR